MPGTTTQQMEASNVVPFPMQVDPPDQPERLTESARFLIAAAGLVAVILSGPALTGLTTSHDWIALVLLGAAASAAERFDINLYGDSRISISGLFLLTTAIALGPYAVVLIAPAVALSGHAGRGRPLYKLVFNASAFVLSSLSSA